MEYLIAAIVGLVYGLLVAILKYIFLWKKLVDPEYYAAIKENQLIARMIISFVTNVVALLLVFFLRNVLPFNFAAAAIATALGLSGGGKIFSMAKTISKINLEADAVEAKETEAAAGGDEE